MNNVSGNTVTNTKGDGIIIQKELTMEDVLEAMLPHTCETCWWMQPNKTPPKQGQCFCRYPGSIETRNNQCLMWKLQPDPLKRYSGSWVRDV